MTLEWIDPPRDYRDEAADLTKQLKENPGRWARIGKGDRYPRGFLGCLHDSGIECRVVNEREAVIEGRARRVADLYARYPKEAE